MDPQQMLQKIRELSQDRERLENACAALIVELATTKRERDALLLAQLGDNDRTGA